MGSSVADVTRSLGSKAVDRLAESTIDPRELLWGILHTLSQIRGSPSYLFPDLLNRCKTVLGLDCSITTGNFLPTLGADTPDQLSAWATEHGWESFANRDLHEVDEVDCKRIETLNIPEMSQGAQIDFQNCLIS